MNNKLFVAVIVVWIILALLIVVPVVTEKKTICTYDNNVLLAKANFDFNNAAYGYPYNQKLVDFAVALKYARCS